MVKRFRFDLSFFITKMQSKALTKETYTSLNDIYNALNKALFQNELPQVLITMHHKKGSLGYFHAKQWEVTNGSNKTIADELNLNPVHFASQGDKEVVSTLLHEMCHVWQEHCGNPPRRCYHNQEFANKMEEVGLMTSSTGKEGGKRTGQKMSDYIIIGGAFDLLYEKHQWKLNVARAGAPEKEKKPKNSKTCYQCPECESKVWGKPNMRIICSDCESEFIEQ